MSTYDEPEKKETHAVARAVVEHLPGWFYDESAQRDRDDELRRSASLQNKDGAEVYMHPVWNKPGRLEIAGTMPSKNGTVYGRTIPDRITVSAKRGAKAIARDITRRFLPGYLELYANATEEKRKHEAAYKEARESMERLATLCGEDLRASDRRNIPDVLTLRTYPDEGPSAEIERHVFSNIGVKLHGLSESQAEAVLRAAGVIS